MFIDLSKFKWLLPTILMVAIMVLGGCAKHKTADQGGAVSDDTRITQTPMMQMPRSQAPRYPESNIPKVRPAGLPNPSSLPSGPTSKPPETNPGSPPQKKPEPPVASQK